MNHKHTAAPQRYFDEKRIPEDVWDVLRAASLLNIGEFRLFELAFRDWYGRRASEKTIEKHFIPYMYRKRVPAWVRHFSRGIIERDEADQLDPRDYGIRPKHATNLGVWKGVLGSIGIALALIILVALAQSVARIMPLACTFPPCY